MKNILYYGDFDCTTGFAKVSKRLIDNWSEDKDVMITVFATNNFGIEKYNYKDNVYVIPATLFLKDDSKDPYFRKELLKLLYNASYDAFFMLNDIEVADSLSEHLRKVRAEKDKENKRRTKYFIYFPIDSPPLESELKSLSVFDGAFTFTDYAKNHVNSVISKKVKTAYHGVDFEDFYKKDVSEMKKALFGEDAYVFGTVNRNSVRKDIPTLIIAFSEIKKKYSNTKLYIHCNPLEHNGVNLLRLLDRLGLKLNDDVHFPKEYNEGDGVSVDALNDIYNMFDCFVTTTTAEGWGLTITEAISCEIPVIAPVHTSIEEISGYGHNILPIDRFNRMVFAKDSDKIRMVSDLGCVMDRMHDAYFLSQKQRDGITKRAKDFALKFDWKKTADTMLKDIKQSIR